MKKLTFTILILFFTIALSAAEDTPIGEITYIQGENVEMATQGQTGRRLAKLKDLVYEQTVIYTDLSSKVEIRWEKDGKLTTIPSNQTVMVGELWDEHLKQTLNPIERLWHNVSKLVTLDEAKSKAPSGVAATRAGEVPDKQDQLHWKSIEVNLEDGIRQFEVKDYQGSIETFDNVIKDNPKSDDAAIAMITKGLAQHHLGLTDEASATFTNFLKEFPEHDLSKLARDAIGQLK